MIIRTEKLQKSYKDAAKISVEILSELIDMVKTGIYPIEIDKKAEKLCKANRVRPAFKGQEDLYSVYGYSTCIALNDTVVHGIPSKTVSIKDGDIVSIDFGIVKDGLYTDLCHTVGVGSITSKDQKLIDCGRNSIQEGVKQAVVGNKIGDIGYAISSHVKRDGFVVAKDFIGHSIGYRLWEEPGIPPIGKRGTGKKLERGMVLCVEAQILAGSDKVYKTNDGWTIKTKDGSNAVMFEYMVIVDETPLVLTDTMSWPVNV